MEAIPVDVALGSFRVDVLTVGKVETPVIVFRVIGAVGPGSSVVSCQFQICALQLGGIWTFYPRTTARYGYLLSTGKQHLPNFTVA